MSLSSIHITELWLVACIEDNSERKGTSLILNGWVFLKLPSGEAGVFPELGCSGDGYEDQAGDSGLQSFPYPNRGVAGARVSELTQNRCEGACPQPRQCCRG